MNHNRSGISRTKRFAICTVVLSLAVGSLVLQVEAFRQLIVKLDGSALMFPFQSIRNGDINLDSQPLQYPGTYLWTVKRTILGIQSPISFTDSFIKGSSQSSFSLIPSFHITKIFLRISCTQNQLELKSKCF